MATERVRILIEARNRAKRDLRSIRRSVRSLGSVVARYGKIAAGAAAAGTAAFAAQAVRAAADMERLEKAMTAVTGSSARAGREIEKLKKTAQLPGLGFREAIQGSVRLQAAGQSAEQARRSLEAFGNAVALAGGGKAELHGVSVALSQIITKGHVMGQEIRQLQERVPQIRQAMIGAFGTARTEDLQAMNIAADEFIDKVTVELNKLPQVEGGLANAFENLSDSFFRLSSAVGSRFAPAVRAATDAVSGLMDEIAGAFEPGGALGEGRVQQFGATLRSALAIRARDFAPEVFGRGVRSGADPLAAPFRFPEGFGRIQRPERPTTPEFQPIPGFTPGLAMPGRLGRLVRAARAGAARRQRGRDFIRESGLIGLATELDEQGLQDRMTETFTNATRGATRDFSENIKPMLARAGASLITGLLDGAKSMEDRIKSFFKNVIGFAVELGLRSALGIASPSKLTFAMGQQLVAGLVQGTRSGMRDIQSTMAGVRDSVVRGMASPEVRGVGSLAAAGAAGAIGPSATVRVSPPSSAAEQIFNDGVHAALKALRHAGVRVDEGRV